jgi:predicted dehydrogenase
VRLYLLTASLTLVLFVPKQSCAQDHSSDRVIRIGVIGLDTSHAAAFTKEINATNSEGGEETLRVVVAYPQGSRSIESSVTRIPAITEEMKSLGVEIVDSVSQLLKQVDAVLLETNDGNMHLEQAKEIFMSKKPVFIDKPVAASMTDVLEIFKLARTSQTPMFSSSALRYGSSIQERRNPVHMHGARVC